METVLISLGTALAAAFAQWIFYFRKHKAVATGAEKQNDRSEIENLKLITQEWRESAQSWKDMADEYRTKYMDYQRQVEQLSEAVSSLTSKLARANKRISHLEKEKANKTNKTPTDGNE